MKEIAKLAGVGKSTVSRYFNGGYVKEDTRQKIKEITEQFEYSPNTVAQALKAKHSYQVVIITPTLESVTSGIVLTHMDEELRSQGYTPIIFNTNHNEERELMSILSLSRMNVEGAILLATHITKSHIDLVKKLNIPFLYVAQETDSGIHIIPDDYLAGYKMGQYVASMNHQDVTYFGVTESDKAVGVVRKNGIMDGLKENGVQKISFAETEFTYDEACLVIRKQLIKNTSTCFMCATDNIAFAAYHEIQKAGLRIPDDISVTGFGGYSISEVMQPQLCTIKFDYEDEGTVAAETICKMIRQEPVESHVVNFQMKSGKSVMKR